MGFSLFDMLMSCWHDLAAVAFSWGTELVSFLVSGLSDLFSNSTVISYETFLSIFADALFIVGIGFAVAQWAISANEGNPDNIMTTFKNIVLGLFASLGFVIIPVNLLKFTCECCQLIVGNMSLATFNQAVQDKMNTDTTVLGTILFPLFCIAMFICIIRVFMSNIKRGGSLIVMMTVAPMHIFSIPRGYTDGFFSWCKQVIALCLTTFVQNFLITLSMLICASSSTASTSIIIMSLGVALAAMEAPRILQQFGMDTTLKTNFTQALMAVNSIQGIARNFRA